MFEFPNWISNSFNVLSSESNSSDIFYDLLEGSVEKFSALPEGAVVKFKEHVDVEYIANLAACKMLSLCYAPNNVPDHFCYYSLDSNEILNRNAIATTSGYLVATSGSTGEPKISMSSWTDLDKYISLYIAAHDIRKADVIANTTNPSFDPFLREVFIPMAIGASLAIPKVGIDRLDIEELFRFLELSNVSVIQTVPTFLRVLTTCGIDLLSLRVILSCGEALYYSDVSNVISAFPSVSTIVNNYGPSETLLSKLSYTIDVSLWDKDNLNERLPVPLGKSFLDEDVRIVKEGRLCGVQEEGEIVIKCKLSSQGWVTLDGAGRLLISKVMNFENNGTIVADIYATNDLGYANEHGEFYFTARRSGEVKLRGIKLDVQSLERSLGYRFKGTTFVYVKYSNKAGIDRLGLLVSGQVNENDVLDFIDSKFEMLVRPSLIFETDVDLRNANGKTDRSKAYKIFNEFVSRLDSEERKSCSPLVKVFSEVLECEADENTGFTAAGGQSIDALYICNFIRKTLQKELKLSELYRCQTPARIEKLLENRDLLQVPNQILPLKCRDELRLSDTQLKFIEWLNSNPKKASALRFENLFKLHSQIDFKRFVSALKKVMSSQSHLKYSVDTRNKVFFNQKNVDLVYEHKCEEPQAVFDLARRLASDKSSTVFLPIQFHLIQTKVDCYVLLLTNVFVSDGNTKDFLLEEISRVYFNQPASQRSATYSEFVAFTNRLEPDIVGYWQSKIENLDQLLRHEYQLSDICQTKVRHLSQEQTALLKRYAAKHQVSTNSVLLHAFVAVISELGLGQSVNISHSNRHQDRFRDIIGSCTDSLLFFFDHDTIGNKPNSVFENLNDDLEVSNLSYINLKRLAGSSGFDSIDTPFIFASQYDYGSAIHKLAESISFECAGYQNIWPCEFYPVFGVNTITLKIHISDINLAVIPKNVFLKIEKYIESVALESIEIVS